MVGPGHRSRLSLVLGAFALLGLFAMHGLGGHGTNHAGAAGHADAVPAHASAHASDHPPAHAACDGACASSQVLDSAPTGSGEGITLLVALCLAVLSAAVAIAVLALTRTSVATGRAPDRAQPLREVLRGLRDRDPPNIYVLSVQRC